MPNAILLGLIAETPIHYGAETGGGAIDLPVAREAATRYPVIAGSAFKGSMKDMLGGESVFTGKADAAGHLIFSDIRLLLLPVRSLAASYAWVTCPLLLERLQRDSSRAAPTGGNAAVTGFTIPVVTDGYYVSANVGLPDLLQLEERQFTKSANNATAVANLENLIANLQNVIAHDTAKNRVKTQMVILSDNDFAWFAEFALPVNAHNQLNANNKTSENLWYEETLPPDTVMYALVLPRPTLKRDIQDAAMAHIGTLLTSTPHLQIGAGETTGLGWFAHNHAAQAEGAI